eukprot:10586681-Alexandrium_andersonii.AAC.1
MGDQGMPDSEFMQHYDGPLPPLPEWELEPLNVGDVLRAMARGASTSPGPDALAAAELRCMSRKAAQRVAHLYNRVELGA